MCTVGARLTETVDPCCRHRRADSVRRPALVLAELVVGQVVDGQVGSDHLHALDDELLGNDEDPLVIGEQSSIVAVPLGADCRRLVRRGLGRQGQHRLDGGRQVDLQRARWTDGEHGPFCSEKQTIIANLELPE